MVDETLEKYREMRDDIVREFDEVIARLDELQERRQVQDRHLQAALCPQDDVVGHVGHVP